MRLSHRGDAAGESLFRRADTLFVASYFVLTSGRGGWPTDRCEPRIGQWNSKTSEFAGEY
jgi:hypothetical protein